MNQTALRVLALSFVAFGAGGVFYGCSDDEAAKPGATEDASVDATSKTDAASSSDATSGSDTGGNTDSGQTDAAEDAAPDVFVIPANPCATRVDGGTDAGADADAGPAMEPAAARQVFTNGMAGCAGKVMFANRAELCNAAAGCTTCTAAEWIANRGGAAPEHQYWVNEALNYTGTEHGCGATTDPPDASANIDMCSPATHPRRVCIDGDGGLMFGGYDRPSQDENGNRCNWTQCDFGGAIPDSIDAGPDADATPPTTNLHFGGCNGNSTAGTLCCCK